MITRDYRPGAIGDITALHGRYYGEVWDFDYRFEAEVAEELSDFVRRYDTNRDGLWLASVDGRFAGAIVIDGSGEADGEARLRWFILAPEHQGQGLGRQLLDQAMGFCDACGLRRVYLLTFAGLDAARKLYEDYGFKLTDERADTDWNAAGVTHQTFELIR